MALLWLQVHLMMEIVGKFLFLMVIVFANCLLRYSLHSHCTSTPILPLIRCPQHPRTRGARLVYQRYVVPVP
jgi:hypothetical protein